MEKQLSLLSIEDTYNQAADIYIELKKRGALIFNDCIDIPAAKKAISELSVEGKSVLDFGCGLGDISLYLCNKKAIVTALDISEKMLKHTETICKGHDIKLIKDDLLKHNFNTKFDLVIGTFMLGYFDNLHVLFSKLSEITKPNGHIVVSMLHPIRLASTRKNKSGYTVENYFKKGMYTSDFLGEDLVIKLHKWTLQDVIKSALEQSFQLDLLVEPQPNNLPKDINKPDIEFYINNPSTILFKFTKIA